MRGKNNCDLFVKLHLKLPSPSVDFPMSYTGFPSSPLQSVYMWEGGGCHSGPQAFVFLDNDQKLRNSGNVNIRRLVTTVKRDKYGLLWPPLAIMATLFGDKKMLCKKYVMLCKKYVSVYVRI